MKKNELLAADLNDILSAHKDLLWTSEGEEKIEVVRKPWYYRLFKSKQEKDGEAEERLSAAISQDLPGSAIKQVVDRLLAEDNLISIKRPTKDRSKFDLYILVWFGWHYVGIRTKLVET